MLVSPSGPILGWSSLRLPWRSVVSSMVNPMNKPNRQLRVGVTINIKEGQQSIWENGISQNCLLLVQLLNLSPEVERAVLINGSGVKEVSKGMFIEAVGLSLIDLEEAQQTLDVVIEMGQQLAYEWVVEFKKRGGKYVFMRVGCDYVIDIERAIFNLAPASLCNNTPYDAVWTIPVHERSCKDYFSVICRAPVKIVPHLWSPQFFEMANSILPPEAKYGYKKGKTRWRVCSFEPNINTLKSCVIPMQVCEEAYRKNPRFLEYYRICNTYHIKENNAFVSYAKSLEIVNHGLATFEGRFPMYDFMAQHGDCIIAHQWECELNYAYYEALYGNYPLIHNSEMLKEYGYYYPDFDAIRGGDVLLQAFSEHDRNFKKYKANCKELLKKLDFSYPKNIEIYSGALTELYNTVSTEKLDLKSNSESPKIFDSVFVINLEKRKDRWESFLSHHPDLKEIAIRKNAIDGRNLKLTPDLARLFKPNGFEWKKSVIGCALSHLALWDKLAKAPSNNEVYLILEDDVRLKADWKQVLEKAQSRNAIPTDFDVLFLGGILPPNRNSFEELGIEKVNEFIAKTRENSAFGQTPPNRFFHFCAYSYAITRSGASKILQIIQENDGYHVPADHMLCNHYERLKIYFFNPLLAGCYQDFDPIYQQSEFNKNLRVDSFDSDLWNNIECYQKPEYTPFLNRKLDIDSALRSALEQFMK
jgi:GR25 family glycosyltransferase involved in LPS biosynthesis